MSDDKQKTSPRLIITERDREVLRFVGRGGIASLCQLHQRHWSGSQLRTASSRLLTLVKEGWLATHRQDTFKRGQPVQVFSLTKQGASLFSTAERERMYLGGVGRHEARQQLLAQAARIALEKQLPASEQQLLDWRNEREVRQAYNQDLFHRRGFQFGSNNYPAITAAKEIATREGEEAGISDAQILIGHADGQQVWVEVECDGYYYHHHLTTKLTALTRLGRPLLYVTIAARAARLKQTLQSWPNCSLLVIDLN